MSVSSTNVSCNGLANGTITISGLSLGATTIIQKDGVGSDLSGQSTFGPGTYVVTASAVNGNTNENCTETVEVTITEPALINLQVSSKNVTCFGEGNGTITATAHQSAIITVNGQPYNSATRYVPGTYIVRAEAPDGNSNQQSGIGKCVEEFIVNITEPAKILVSAGVNRVITCAQSSITLNGIVSNQGNFGYQWATTNGVINGATNILNPVVTSAGTYVLTVTNLETSCTASSSVVITQNIKKPEMVLSTTGSELNCNVQSISLSVTGVVVQGSASYIWVKGFDLVQGANSANLTVTEPGEYIVQITDSANGCTTAKSIVITQDILNPAVEITGNQELTCANPTTTLVASGVVQGSASYLWNTGATTASIAVTVAGEYSVTITDSDNGCSTEASVTVTQDITKPSAVVITGNKELTCANPITTLVASGVVQGAASYLWNTGATTARIAVTAPGNYSVTITDSDNGCSTEASVTVTQDITKPSAVEITGNQELTCANPTTTLVASGTVQGTASYLWNTGAKTASIAVTAPGNYSVTITDSDNGCSTTASVSVGQDITKPSAVAIAGNKELTCANPTTTLVASGTVQGAASYLWNTGATTASIAVTVAGEYSVTITDSENGCTNSTSVIVKENKTDIEAVIKGETKLTCLNNSIVLDGSTSIAIGNVSYLWSNGATTSQITITTPGDYSLTVSAGINGCSNTKVVKVIQDITKPVVSITGNEELTCTKTSIKLNAAASIVQGVASYLWNTGATTSTIDVVTAGKYSATVTGSENGCSASLTMNVTSNYGVIEVDGNSIALCISEVPLNLQTLLPEGYLTGGTWKDDDISGGLNSGIFDPSKVNLADYEFTYTESGDCGRKIVVFVNVNDDCIVLPCSTEGAITISKVVTANDDGVNDVFEIKPNLMDCGFTAEVQIFNRWGKIVFESTNYQNNWKGYHNNSGLTVNSNGKLPTGTYFYVVKIIGSGYKPITGYIYLGTH